MTDLIDQLGGLAGTALWASQSLLARKLVAPPPMVSHFGKRDEYLHKTVRYSGNLKLDIWKGPDRRSPAPVLMFIPGGAWLFGDRRIQGYALMSHLVDQGWICVSIDYRTAPRHRWPAPFEDVQKAYYWVHRMIAKYGGDPNFIAVAGASAGGHMASLLGLTWDHWELPRPGAVVSLYGVYDWTKGGSLYDDSFSILLEKVIVGKSQNRYPVIYRDASPILHVRPDAPPFAIVQGTRDRLTPARGAHEFFQSLADISEATVIYHKVPKVGHGFDLVDPKATVDAMDVIAGFLRGVKRREAQEVA